MTTIRRHVGGLVLATSLLAAGTVGVASLLAGSPDGLPAAASALGRRAAADWLAVAALVLLAGWSLDPCRRVTRRTVGALALAVFFGGVGVEAWPVAERLLGPAPLDYTGFLRGVTAAVRGALFPTALFLGAVVGTTAVRGAPSAGTRAGPAEPSGARAGPGDSNGIAVRPATTGDGGVTPRLAARTLRPIAVVAAFSLGLTVTTRLALGAEHLAFVVADAGIAALSGLVTYGVLALALVAVAVRGRGGARLAGLTVAVWLALFVGSLAVGVLGGLVGALLTSQTTTPVVIVERSTLAHWPSPVSGTMLLGTATFVAGAGGLRSVRRAAGPADVAEPSARRNEATESGSSAGDPGDAG